MYYLQSRYYNPKWGRFINADTFVSTGQGLLGNNMFAYCLNNPVNYSDPDGRFVLVDDIAVALTLVYGVAILAIIMSPPVQRLIWDFISGSITTLDKLIRETGKIVQAKTKGKENIRDTGLANLSDEEVQRRAHDPKLPAKERERYKKEEKARGLRNVNKRKGVYRFFGG